MNALDEKRNVLLEIADKRASGALDRMLTDDTVFNVDFYVDPKILIEG